MSYLYLLGLGNRFKENPLSSSLLDSSHATAALLSVAVFTAVGLNCSYLAGEIKVEICLQFVCPTVVLDQTWMSTLCSKSLQGL